MRVRYALSFAGIVVFSVVLPIVLNSTALSQKLSGVEQLLIGLLTAILLGVAQVGYLLSEQIATLRRDGAEWIASNDAEEDLVVIRAQVRMFLSQERQLFFDMFARDIKALAGRAEHAQTGGVKLLHHDDDATAMMLRRYEAPTSDILRMVHFLGDNDFFYDTHARDFFRDVYDRVLLRHISEVRRLLVWEETSQLAEPRTRALASFHQHTPHHDYRFMARADFDKIAVGLAEVPTIPRDFGIYGDSFAYVSTGTTAADAIGSLVCSDGVIERLQTLFDKCWTSTSANRARQHLPESDVATLEAFFHSAGADPQQIHQNPVGWIIRTARRPQVVKDD